MSPVSTMSVSTRPSLLCGALQLNNQATALIAKGSYEEAASTLAAALVQLRQALRGSPSVGDDCPMSAESCSQREEREGCLRFHMHDSTSQDFEMSVSLKDDLGEDEWYLHRYPIQVAEATGLDSTSDIAELISFAAIYNLGLSHHLHAISLTLTNDRMRQVRLQRATAFYEHAQRLLAGNQNAFDPNMIFDLVIANNLGNAHYNLGNDSTGELYFQRSMNTLLHISQNRGSETVMNCDENRWDGFMENIMHHLIGKISHAAAA